MAFYLLLFSFITTGAATFIFYFVLSFKRRIKSLRTVCFQIKYNPARNTAYSKLTVSIDFIIPYAEQNLLDRLCPGFAGNLLSDFWKEIDFQIPVGKHPRLSVFSVGKDIVLNNIRMLAACSFKKPQNRWQTHCTVFVKILITWLELVVNKHNFLQNF